MKMAELAANEIYDIRENRSLLAKGQADFMPKDGTQLKMMMEQLDKQEAGLLMLLKEQRAAKRILLLSATTQHPKPELTFCSASPNTSVL